MRNADFFRTLSGCRFYRTYCEVLQSRAKEPAFTLAKSPGRPPPDAAALRVARNRVFRKYAAILAAMVFGSLLVVVGPMWLAYAPFGKACLLSLPPMLLCAVSWMAGAWWGSDKPQYVLMAVTLGLIPVRVLLVLGWAWLALAVPGMPVEAFFLALMFHWIVFACAEMAMLVELSRLGTAERATGLRFTSAGTAQRYRLDSGETSGQRQSELTEGERTLQSPGSRRDLVGSVH